MIKITLLNRRHGVHSHVWQQYTRQLKCDLCGCNFQRNKCIEGKRKIYCKMCSEILIFAKIEKQQQRVTHKKLKEYYAQKVAV